MTATPAAPPPSPFSVPIFRAIWFASMSSNFGGLVQAVGASWLMTTLTTSPQQVALVQASTALPIMLFSLTAGAIADNLDRRKVMLIAQFYMVAVSLLLAWCAWAGVLTPWGLLGFTFAIGCGTALNNPAWQASVGDMVPRAALPGAVALNSMGFNMARSVGPAIGGAIVAVAGAAGAFLTNALSYVGLIVVLLRWHPVRAPRTLPREHIATAMLAGLRYVAMSPNLCVVMARAALFGAAAAALPALMPVVARDLIVGGPLTYGILLGAFGIGAVAGALSSGRLRARLSTEAIVRVATLVLVLGGIGTALSHTLILTLPALMLAGSGWVLALSTFNVTVQLSTPRWVVGRALSLYQMAAFGGLAAGAWTFGAIAEAQGVTRALLAAAALQAVGGLLGLVLPLPRSGDADLEPAGHMTAPATTVPVDARSGPIVITVEHRVAAHNSTAFVAAMNERRRICRRDGARRWTLLRDLADPDLWVERYHVATWLEYVRDRQRRTRADQQNHDLIQSLHIDGHAPRVHRFIERPVGSATYDPVAEVQATEDALTDPTRAN
ncbi:Predicted arabinose efflux permease, MFS family [Loktanella fryxellensis]|uniref:Predicted arabinose efflux permease, MFS family n=1 Tax=Loktanella fryxellensis TaxID=245187 RepID=A0A1H8HCE9_9RHOB|nr:MFS transporter [Loktanella fryxellensis]SEN53649.1 Predicted arabinose efflux permease, MFS family [Loktanella fryxellensis]